MTDETFTRIIVGFLGAFILLLLVRKLVTGRLSFARHHIRRDSDPRDYWSAVGSDAILFATCAAVLLWVHHGITPVLFIGLLAAQLLDMLVSGKVWRSRDRAWTRTGDPRPYWSWVALHLVMLAAFVALQLWLLASPTTP